MMILVKTILEPNCEDLNCKDEDEEFFIFGTSCYLGRLQSASCRYFQTLLLLPGNVLQRGPHFSILKYCRDHEFLLCRAIKT